MMRTVLAIIVVAIPLAMVGWVFVFAMCKVAARPTPPVNGPVGEDGDD